MTNPLLRRLSRDFLLLDTVYSYENYLNSPLFMERMLDDYERVVDMGTRFCTEWLTPMVDTYGPVSLSCGICFNCKGPHLWNKWEGVAVDAIFHDWVNSDTAPILLLHDMDVNGLEYERIISYAGSEVLCLSWKPDGNNRAAFYENVRTNASATQGSKPLFITHGSKPSDRADRMGRPKAKRRDWRRDAYEPIFHTRRQLRPQHIRMSQYFTLLDMCRHVEAFASGENSVTPPELFHSRLLDGARCVALVLDDYVAAHGMMSVVRGMLPTSMADAHGVPLHGWTGVAAAGEGQMCVEVAVHHDYPDISGELLKDDRVAASESWEDEDSRYYRLVIDYQEPTFIMSSANHIERR
ncbi:hypothetical protein H10PHJ05_13 [Aeromonas phage HJ05]|nr:hypothetical protein H10PHJ05_13 [Aeromonas phage HJ05]